MKTEVVYDKLEDLQAKVEYNGGGIDALKEEAAVLKTMGAVKSVQRGVFSDYRTEADQWNILANISSVNTSKAFMYIWLLDQNGAYVNEVYFRLNGSAIEVYTDAYMGLTGDWQVIEFY